MKKLKPELEIYQMGISGVPLSQYLKMLSYADNEFSAKHYIINITGNDFEESLCELKEKEGTWCFDKNYELKFIPFYGYSIKRKIARNSAFARYLVFNIGINWREILFKFKISDPGIRDTIIGLNNLENISDEQKKLKTLKALNIFFNQINELNLNDKVTLMIDTERYQIYDENLFKNTFGINYRERLIDLAKKNKVDYIDLEPIFITDYKKNNIKFEFPNDGHWNEYAHELIAKSFLNKKTRLFSK